MAKEKKTNESEMAELEESDEEEEGEVIESKPPLKVGEEREISCSGVKKKLLHRGSGWETPGFADEVTVHYVGTLLDGTNFTSTRDKDEPFTFKLGHGIGGRSCNSKMIRVIKDFRPIELEYFKFQISYDRILVGAVHIVLRLLWLQRFTLSSSYSSFDKSKHVVKGLDSGIITMKKGEIALFTLPLDMGCGIVDAKGVPPGSIVHFEVELISWIMVVDVCRDGGIIKRILKKSESDRQPSELDEVLVKYQFALPDGSIVAKTAEEGVEFYIKYGHLIPALPKVIKTMKVGEKANLIVQPQYGYGDVGRDGSDGFCSVPPNSVLNIDVELTSFKPVIDVSGDSKVMKKILQEGESLVTADDGAIVSVKCVGKLEDGTIFDKKGFDSEVPLEFITGEEQVVSGLDRAASTMKKGEHSLVTISPEYGYGDVEVKKDLATIPPSSNLIYEIEMVDLIKEKAPWEMSSQERIEAARKNKEEGNVLFEGGRYERAAKKYDKAADYVSDEGSFECEEVNQVKALRVQCWLNSAACTLKLNNFMETINLCSKVLDVECQNVKALYRRAQAYMENEVLHLAAFDIKKALEVDPHNREVKMIQKSLKQRQAESDSRDAKIYEPMFAPPSKRLKKENKEDGNNGKRVVPLEEDDNAVNPAPDNETIAISS